MDLAVLIPARNARETLPALVESIDKTCEKLELAWEVLVVDDGSTDKTFELVEELAITNDRIWAIRLRQSFGTATALAVGFDSTEAEHVITVDGDGRLAPEDVTLILENLRKGADLVHGGASASAGSPRGFRGDCGRSLDLHGELHRHAPLIAARRGWQVAEVSLAPVEGSTGRAVLAYPRGSVSLLSALHFSRRRRRLLDLSVGVGAAFGLAGAIAYLYLLIVWIAGVEIAGKPLVVVGGVLILLGALLATFGLLGQMLLSTRREVLGPAADREMIERVLEPIPVES